MAGGLGTSRFWSQKGFSSMKRRTGGADGEGARYQILIAGLGEVAQTHLRVLEQTPGADLVAGLDIAAKPEMTFRGHTVPLYRTPHDAAARHNPDIVVIATPTPTHAAVCGQITACFPTARLLMEKPAADTLPGARHVLVDIG